MSRKRISEFRAKTLLGSALKLVQNFTSLGVTDEGELDFAVCKNLPSGVNYVLKVDQGIKKRGKQGLLELDLALADLKSRSRRLFKLGYRQFIVEEFVPHPKTAEKYLSLERVRQGIRVLYSPKGGVDVESQSAVMQTITLSEPNYLHKAQWSSKTKKVKQIAATLEVRPEFIADLLTAFDHYHFAFLEINPLLVKDDQVRILDLAVEVDSAAELFVQGAWTSSDFVTGSNKVLTAEEQAVNQLNRKSQASLKLDLLNPDGSIWVLLSGGGASIVLADEINNLGYGKELANYGEYSGNPNRDEVEVYTQNLISLLLKSQAKKKVLIIAGGIANFTDIKQTFSGVLLALAKYNKALLLHRVKVFVRRGGPNQLEGLASVRDFLTANQLLGQVAGPELTLTEIVQAALAELAKAD